MINAGQLAFRLQCITLPSFGIIMIANMMMQTTAHTMQASLTALARQGLIFLPLILTLPLFWGLLGVQIAQPVADGITFLLVVYMQSTVLNEMKRQQQQTES